MRVPDDEIIDYMKLAGLTWPIHKGLVRAHFNMEDTSGSIILDQAGSGFHGNLFGRPVFVPVRNNNPMRRKFPIKNSMNVVHCSFILREWNVSPNDSFLASHVVSLRYFTTDLLSACEPS